MQHLSSGKKCQKAHWKKGHRDECPRLSEMRIKSERALEVALDGGSGSDASGGSGGGSGGGGSGGSRRTNTIRDGGVSSSGSSRQQIKRNPHCDMLTANYLGCMPASFGFGSMTMEKYFERLDAVYRGEWWLFPPADGEAIDSDANARACRDADGAELRYFQALCVFFCMEDRPCTGAFRSWRKTWPGS